MPIASDLEILLPPHKIHPRIAILIALNMQRRPQRFRSAKEDTRFSRTMNPAHRFENLIPVGTTEVCGGAETRDGVLFGVGIVDHYVCCVVGFDFGGEVLQ